MIRQNKYLKTFLVLAIVAYFGISIIHSSPHKAQATDKTLLQPSDFTYLGYYDVHVGGSESAYGQGLTSRYVNGDLRFLTMQYGGGSPYLSEFSIAGKNYGDTISTGTNQWSNMGGDQLQGSYVALYWNSATNQLWTTRSVDYTTEVQQVQLYTRTLNDDGTVSNIHGPVGFSGINAKRVYGGCQANPTWFQQAYNVGPYACGWGGYTSLVQQGGGASMGPTFYAIPDPNSYSSGDDIPVGSFKTLMDSGGAPGNDWYSNSTPTTYDRGSRLNVPINYYDGGDPRQNPQTEPTDPPVSSAQWLSPAPDGVARWVWSDSYYNTGTWIDTPTKTGFIAIGSFCGGKCWYGYSTLHDDYRVYELHIFDPATLGQAALGQLQPWQVKPASMSEMTFPGLGDINNWGPQIPGGIGGVTYDPSTSRLYLMGFGLPAGTNDSVNRLYVYQVNTGSSGTPPPPPPPPPTPLPGDLNLDHIVNSLDWSIMNSKWFTNDATADINKDGIVNAIDFSILNNNWFKTW